MAEDPHQRAVKVAVQHMPFAHISTCCFAGISSMGQSLLTSRLLQQCWQSWLLATEPKAGGGDAWVGTQACQPLLIAVLYLERVEFWLAVSQTDRSVAVKACPTCHEPQDVATALDAEGCCSETAQAHVSSKLSKKHDYVKPRQNDIQEFHQTPFPPQQHGPSVTSQAWQPLFMSQLYCWLVTLPRPSGRYNNTSNIVLRCVTVEQRTGGIWPMCACDLWDPGHPRRYHAQC
jgi:hypothetical protein